MRILWVVNIVFPEASSLAKRKAGYGGGWIRAMAERLAVNASVELGVAIPGKIDNLKPMRFKNITFYTFRTSRKLRYGGGGHKMATKWRTIIEDFRPDIVHAYGTEYQYNYQLINNNRQIPILLSLQGLLTEYHKHYYAGMEMKDILFNVSLRDIVFGSSMILQRKQFKRNSRREQEILSEVKYVEGRTLWDKTAALNMNEKLKYYHCPRMLRKEFYCCEPWNVDEIMRHTIIVHQATYPIKGLHHLLDAVFLVRRNYPDIRLFVAGTNILDRSSLKKKLMATGYSYYIGKKIKALDLENSIEFVGSMNSGQLIDLLRKVHVMVLPSSIENSPNSLAESMMVGVPCVASYVGGVPSMLKDKHEGLLYAFNDSGMLSAAISQIFESDDLARELSLCARATALERHDPSCLEKTLLEIYKDIIRKFGEIEQNA